MMCPAAGNTPCWWAAAWASRRCTALPGGWPHRVSASPRCWASTRASEIFLAEEFRALGAEVIIATADGSAGLKGLVTDGMAAVSDYTYLYTCGPEPMLKAVYSACKTSGQFSFEERMGCGFGACMGCSCETKYGNKRICKDGPVLEKEEIVW